MKNIVKILLVISTSLLLANCSTYSVKKDMNKNGYINKTPKWYVDYKHETWKTFQEAAVSVSPDMELAVKKSILLAKAKLADRINGEINNRTTINKNEAGINESLTVNAQAQDTIVNVIENTLVRFYEVTKQEIFMTNHKSYRVYVMLEVSKKDIDKIIAEINKKNVAVIDVDEINKRANEVLNNKG
jgi:hypothetical protein|tara:strand:+ start:496 stop:1056 length:561 start_codon:yes stop_codon:yes gene_type:complete